MVCECSVDTTCVPSLSQVCRKMFVVRVLREVVEIKPRENGRPGGDRGGQRKTGWIGYLDERGMKK